jgi:hypothetical protein
MAVNYIREQFKHYWKCIIYVCANAVPLQYQYAEAHSYLYIYSCGTYIKLPNGSEVVSNKLKRELNSSSEPKTSKQLLPSKLQSATIMQHQSYYQT